MPRKRPARRRSRTAATLALLVSASCGDVAASRRPEWLHLADASLPLQRREARELVTPGGRRFRVVGASDGTWIEADLVASDWRAADAGHGSWAAPLAIRGRRRPKDDAPPWRLQSAARTFRALSEAGELATAAPGSFAVSSDEVLLRLEPGQAAPERATLALFVGQDAVGDRSVEGRRFSGEAIGVWPGQSVSLDVQGGTGRCLRFASTSEPAIAVDDELSLAFRVRLDGELLFEHVHADAQRADHAWHALRLPDAAPEAEQRLEFEVEGPPAYTAFFAPVIGPRRVGDYGERPWGATRPDIVVFLADTFRADNLAAYGSAAGLTPYIDHLAEQSMLFRRAWSVSTYTMPAHSSMFSGYYARQAWATTTTRSLPERMKTIAELLSERGYRTGAITDSSVVSQVKGLAQGFEWFDEFKWTLRSTSERAHAFLDADDGRPVFLFVQSYRTHTPYRVSRETAREHGAALGLEQDFQEAVAELDSLYGELGATTGSDMLRDRLRAVSSALAETHGAAPADVLARFDSLVQSLRALYLGGVADLDRGFEAFHEGLVRRGVLEHGYFLFASDHGEAFMEHDWAFHTGKVWEELTRIPLFLSGPGVERCVVEHAASLIDFAPTIADMAGFPAEAGWSGTSLLRLERDRPVFLFENHDDPGSSFAVVEGSRKAFGYEDPAAIRAARCSDAYDLARDAAESRNLARSEAWPRELLRELGPTVELLMTPLMDAEDAELDAAKIEELRAMGYAAD